MTSAQTGPHDWTNVYSTHDHTTTVASTTLSPDLGEAWADVKSPGDGHTYAVGTVEVVDTHNAPTFSNAQVTLPPSPAVAFFVRNVNARRQVVILQCRDANHAITWQTFLYGYTAGAGEEAEGQPTNARGISVWPAADRAHTRIAICGETYDRYFPGTGDQWLHGGGAGAPQHAAGFIAVYDGYGALLWSQLFWGNGPYDCAITDVSIRRQTVGSVDRDTVTYCGISSHGASPAAVGGTPLDPVRWFAAPAGYATSAAGNTDNGPGQWDGIVGRIWRDHTNTLSTQTAFHAIVGGWEQDGLFGIAEMENDRLVAVGTTATTGSVGTSTFPFTLNTFDPGQSAFYCVGATAIFDASATGTGGGLVLEASNSIGNPGTSWHTAARDVAVQPRAGIGTIGYDRIFVVGSTDDPNLASSTMGSPTPGFQPALAGMTDGYVFSAQDVVGAGLVPWDHYTFRGGPGDDGCVGVAAWNEYSDHVAVLGFTRPDRGANDFDVLSILVDTTNPASTSLKLLRGGQIGGWSVETPAAMGMIHATAVGLAYVDFNLGSPAGGAIAMDPRARVDVVGATESDPAFGLSYPLVEPGVTNTTGGLPFLSGATSPPVTDAIHTVIDPVSLGVSRTDETGTRYDPSATSYSTGPWQTSPPAPAFGGTTPVCALLPFGTQIGSAPPTLSRILIDYQGPQPAPGVPATVLVDRPPAGCASSPWPQLLMQVSYPLTAPVVPIPGMEVWISSWNGVPPTIVPNNGNGATVAFSLGNLPGGSGTNARFSVQCFAWIPGLPFTCAGQTGDGWASSAALSFEY